MSQEGEIPKPDPFLIDKIPYSQNQSREFDDLLRSKAHVIAGRDNLSKPTKDKLLMSGWHVPCHCIITRTSDGTFQAFHIQPNKSSASLLTYEQKQALKTVGQQNARAITAKGIRSWFSIADERELEKLKIKLERVINVETANWWRLLYNPETNEIWIDISDQKILLKYRGFENNKPVS